MTIEGSIGAGDVIALAIFTGFFLGVLAGIGGAWIAWRNGK